MSDYSNGEMNGALIMKPEDVDMEESMETQSQDQSQFEYDDSLQPSNDIPYDDHKLFVGGLTAETNEQVLKEYFCQYGTLNEVNLKTDGMSGRSRGFAFLVFAEDDAVDKALSACPHIIDGKTIDAKKAIPHAVHQQMKNRTKKVFVGGVPTDMPEDTIREYFEQFGPIEEVALVTEKGAGPKGEKKRRGFCFVTFENEDIAEKACSKSFHKIENAEVEVKRATPREQDNKRQPHYPVHPHFIGRGRGHFGPYPGGRGGSPAHWAPYGGHAGYYSFYPPPPPPPYGGGYIGGYSGYGGYGGYGYEQYGRGREEGYNSRYGPMRSNYSHSHGHSHGHSHHHPYSR